MTGRWSRGRTPYSAWLASQRKYQAERKLKKRAPPITDQDRQRLVRLPAITIQKKDDPR